MITAFLAKRLTENPDIQERLYEEMVSIKSRVGDGALTNEILNEMKYAGMVINEGLRMCKIAPFLKRRATKPYVLENDNGDSITVRPGEALWLPAFIMQNDPKYYKNPSVFDPKRFNDENRKNHINGTYAPFGIGPRKFFLCL